MSTQTICESFADIIADVSELLEPYELSCLRNDEILMRSPSFEFKIEKLFQPYQLSKIQYLPNQVSPSSSSTDNDISLSFRHILDLS